MSRCSAAANYSSPAIADAPGVMAASSAEEKIALFRRLFAGRSDVFTVRWKNRKTAKSGYAPACANEWVKGICGKPQVKCGECPHQAFVPVTDEIIDKDLRPYDDQWAFLAAIPRLSAKAASEIVGDAEMRGRVLGVRMPVEDEEVDKPWRMTPSRRAKVGPIGVPQPSKITIVVADQLYIDRVDLPPAMTARLIRLAAFQNPEFYRAQSMRFPTFGKPRIISCAELHARHVGLPRGCLDEAVALIRGEGAEVEVDDLRVIGNPLPSRVRFQGTLYGPQVKAFDALLPHDHGVLAATTAFGKTVVAAALIAHRGRNALVLVHRRELLTQWVERLRTFLDIDPKDIGIIGGGRRKPTGIIDVALIQSLVRQSEVSDLVADYGHLVVDECHHLSAASFELVARRAKARYVLGLSATQGCSTLFTEAHGEDGFETAERRGIAVLGDRVGLIDAQDIVGEAAHSREDAGIFSDARRVFA